MAAVLTSEWQEQVRKSYRPRSLDTISDVTFPNRHPVVDNYLDGFMGNYGSKVNALLVGVGKKSAQTDTGAVRHVELARKFTEAQKDYEMTILDVDRAALDEARNRGGSRMKYAEGDIVTMDLSKYGPFDYTECLNVLEHVGTDESGDAVDNQRLLAVSNIARNTNRGGLIVLDNIRNGQWDGLTQPDDTGTNIDIVVSKDAMSAMGIKLDAKLRRSTRSISYLFYRKL